MLFFWLKEGMKRLYKYYQCDVWELIRFIFDFLHNIFYASLNACLCWLYSIWRGQSYCIMMIIMQTWGWIWYRYVPTFVLFENSFWSFHKVSCVVLYLARVNFWQRNIYSTLFNFLITKAYRKISDTFNPINYRSLNRVLFETALGNQDEITG